MYYRINLSISYLTFNWEGYKITEPINYARLKGKIKNDKSFDLLSFFENIKKERGFLIILISLISFFSIFIVLLTKFGDSLFFGILLLGLYLGLIGSLITLYNFLMLSRAKKRYYKKMYRDLLESNDFEDYISIRRENYLFLPENKLATKYNENL